VAVSSAAHLLKLTSKHKHHQRMPVLHPVTILAQYEQQAHPA